MFGVGHAGLAGLGALGVSLCPGQAGMLSNVMKQQNAVRKVLRAAPRADPGLAGCTGDLAGHAGGLFLFWGLVLVLDEFFGLCWSHEQCCAGTAMAQLCGASWAVPGDVGVLGWAPGTPQTWQDTQLALQLVFGASQGWGTAVPSVGAHSDPGRLGDQGKDHHQSSISPWMRAGSFFQHLLHVLG